MDRAFLSETELFANITPAELAGMLSCLGAHEQRYAKGARILRAGETTSEIGLVLEGSVNIVVNSYWGGSSIFGHVERGQIFAETYAALQGKELLCDVVAAEPCTVLFLKLQKLMTSCSNACACHSRLIHNMIRLFAANNLGLSSRMMHISHRTIRQRLLSYLSEQRTVNADAHFVIPFSRQELADYLEVDRTALSNELSKMQREGLLTFRKNVFTLSFANGEVPL